MTSSPAEASPVDTDWLAQWAVATPDAPALVEDDGAVVTYAQLDTLADEAALEIRDRTGVEGGDITVVAVRSVGSPLVAMLWALWRHGVAPLLLDQRSPLVVGWDTESGDAIRERWDMDLPQVAPAEQLHSVVLTSGSTAGPRPVRLTKRNVAAAVAGSQRRLGNGSADRWLLNLPLFHVGGLAVLWRSAAAGGSVVIHEQFDPVRTAQAMHDGVVTMASLVPTMLRRILRADPGPYRGMRGVLLGGAAANLNLVEEALEAGLPVLQTYGMTETCSQVATVAPGEEWDALGTAGRPLSGVEVTIDDDDNGVGEMGVGEIVVHGPTVSPGYLGETSHGGGHHTGDRGYFDEAGRLVVLGRVDDMIVTGGENVHPQQVADVLSQCRLVDDVEVLGVPDAEWGEAVVAVVTGDRATRHRVERWARQRLERHQVPKQWFFVDEMPVLFNGKLDRVALRRLVVEG